MASATWRRAAGAALLGTVAAALAGCAGFTIPWSDPDEPWGASGTEPFWSATVVDDLLRVERAGHDTIERSLERTVETGYGRRLAGTGFTIDVFVQPCTNAMSGARFPETVSLRIDGLLFDGCGGPVDQSSR